MQVLRRLGGGGLSPHKPPPQTPLMPEPESKKNVQEPKPNRKVTVKPNTIPTPMSWYLLGSFTE